MCRRWRAAGRQWSRPACSWGRLTAAGVCRRPASRYRQRECHLVQPLVTRGRGTVCVRDGSSSRAGLMGLSTVSGSVDTAATDQTGLLIKHGPSRSWSDYAAPLPAHPPPAVCPRATSRTELTVLTHPLIYRKSSRITSISIPDTAIMRYSDFRYITMDFKPSVSVLFGHYSSPGHGF